MDFTKLGSNAWSAPGFIPDTTNTIDGFLDDTRESKLAKSVGDILEATRSKSIRFYAGDRKSFLPLNHVQSMPTLQTQTNSSNQGLSSNQIERKSANKRIPVSAARKPPPGVSYSISERPPNRVEVARLETELEDRVKSVLETEATDLEAVETGNMYQPHRDEMIIIRDSLFREFGVGIDNISMEPWLEKLIQCESLRSTCDSVASKLTDMLSVGSAELGNVLRKLRLTYKETFEQMRKSWKGLREIYLENEKELRSNRQQLLTLQDDNQMKERNIQRIIDREIANLTKQYDSEKRADKELLAQTEFKMDQMSETLKSLNGIFKTMQSDSSTLRAADLGSKCARLEKENAELLLESMAVDKLKLELTTANTRIQELDREVKSRDANINSLKLQLNRREEVIADLMEKEAMRNAEIEKLQKLATLKDKEADELELKESATSVLCIKCKKSLDDMSNIRAAIKANGEGTSLTKLHCEALRILLPNLKGRQPHRNSNWLRLCMRSILLSKLREDVSLCAIKGEMSRFPQFVYAWFERGQEGLTGSALTKSYVLADEDRWGLYYGIRALSRENDPEAVIFWSLLDEFFGEDGLQFICYCLSVALSVGGVALWAQFGDCFSKCASINLRSTGNEDRMPAKRFIWLDITTAKNATKVILARALQSHLFDAYQSIDAFLVMPEVEERDKDATSSSSKNASDDPTHIDLFLWLRLMLQQLHAEQIQRGAALRLMFETASVGALTPQVSLGKIDTENPGHHVEFPQFQSICRTLFQGIATTEVATLYAFCYAEGKSKVTADVLQKICDRRGLFSRYMRLATLPLLIQHYPRELVDAAIATTNGIGSILTPEDALKIGDLLLSIQESTRTATGEDGQLVLTSNSDVATVAPPERELPSSEKVKNIEVARLRLNIGALIHVKFTTMIPDIQRLMSNVPEKWKRLLAEAMDNVHFSLQESYSGNIRKKLGDSFNENDPSSLTMSMPKNLAEKPYKPNFIDGIQPFVAYRRLLSLALMVKSLTDNPLLPVELFTDKSQSLLSDFDPSLRAVVSLLSSLENGLIIGTLGRYVETSKAKRFDSLRIVVIVRKLQIVFRHYFNDDRLAIPRSVRMYLRPGYVRGDNLVKKRELHHDPWWAQMLVAEVFTFKHGYDKKAKILGLPTVSIAQAIPSMFFYRTGSVEIAERLTHDFLFGCRVYRDGVPRLRLFCAFINVAGDDLDAISVAPVLQTNQAVAVYLTLLLEIHQEIHMHSVRDSLDEALVQNLMQKSIASNESELNEKTNAVDLVRQVKHPLASEVFHEIETLFPSSCPPFVKVDRRDVWTLDIKIIIAAITRWSSYQKGIELNPTTYTDLLDKLKSSDVQNGSCDVDDALWIVMIQWAKNMSWYMKKCASKASWSDKFSPISKTKNSGIRPSGASSFTLGFIGNLVEGVYRPGEGARIADPKIYSTMYLDKVAKRVFRHTPGSNSPSSTEQLLKDCSLWDLNSAFNSTHAHGGSHHTGLDGIIGTHTFIDVRIKRSTANYLIAGFSQKLYYSYKDIINQTINLAQGIIGDTDMDVLKQTASIALNFIDTASKKIELNYSLNDMVAFAAMNVNVSDEDLLKLQLNLQTVLQFVDHCAVSGVCKGKEFPRDSWKGGRRYHVDRAAVYSISTKNNMI